MFADRAKIFISSGKGGDGHVSFRRELYVPDGGGSGHGHAPGDNDGTLLGDINGDGEVNIADVNAIIDLILRGK